jgi:protease-4
MNESQPPESPRPENHPPATSAAPAGARGEADRLGGGPGWELATFEKLMFATLEEQRTARRWRSFVRLAWLAFFVFLLWALMYPYRLIAGRSRCSILLHRQPL